MWRCVVTTVLSVETENAIRDWKRVPPELRRRLIGYLGATRYGSKERNASKARDSLVALLEALE